ncbi:hypothetical protein DFH08DRAFT_932918 [Mycena albidolilacea]|uniref:Uncharacterized protein n=1 Tax=Mycena albidolilacea TaxID=1033008 RepID=A0AAD7EZ39_9AGAR|nr:hypothetical protein DFH08DRAFT_932918 [Mycena albidolilacea]
MDAGGVQRAMRSQRGAVSTAGDYYLLWEQLSSAIPDRGSRETDAPSLAQTSKFDVTYSTVANSCPVLEAFRIKTEVLKKVIERASQSPPFEPDSDSPLPSAPKRYVTSIRPPLGLRSRFAPLSASNGLCYGEWNTTSSTITSKHFQIRHHLWTAWNGQDRFLDALSPPQYHPWRELLLPIPQWAILHGGPTRSEPISKCSDSPPGARESVC